MSTCQKGSSHWWLPLSLLSTSQRAGKRGFKRSALDRKSQPFFLGGGDRGRWERRLVAQAWREQRRHLHFSANKPRSPTSQWDPAQLRTLCWTLLSNLATRLPALIASRGQDGHLARTFCMPALGLACSHTLYHLILTCEAGFWNGVPEICPSSHSQKAGIWIQVNLTAKSLLLPRHCGTALPGRVRKHLGCLSTGDFLSSLL